MKYTENYNLKKPEAEDFYNVEDFNENMEVIDGKLKDLEDNKETPAGAQAKADAAESAAKSYTDTHENKTSTHGATATPTANRIAMYDSSNRLSSGAAPTSNNHVVRKVDLDSHINSVSAHSATATPTASRIAMYDSSNRLSSGAAPTSNNHVVRKVDLDSHINSDSAHSATATPTASKIAMYDSGKRLSSGAAPSNDNHVVRKTDLDAGLEKIGAEKFQLSGNLFPQTLTVPGGTASSVKVQIIYISIPQGKSLKLKGVRACVNSNKNINLLIETGTSGIYVLRKVIPEINNGVDNQNLNDTIVDSGTHVLNIGFKAQGTDSGEAYDGGWWLNFEIV